MTFFSVPESAEDFYNDVLKEAEEDCNKVVFSMTVNP